MLENMEKWVGPFQVRQLLDRCLDERFPKPPESNSCYLVTQNRWRRSPSARSALLYIGGNTGTSKRFRTRLGDLLADMFGFYGGESGHHSGGQSIHKWCRINSVNPSELYIAWIEGTECHRCLEGRLCRALQPELNQKTPDRCSVHS